MGGKMRWGVAAVLLVATMALSGCALFQKKRFYTNPVIDDEKTELADPTVLLHDGVYYLYATEGSTRQIHVYTSSDLVHWTRGPLVFAPGEKGVWAPDVFFDPVTRKFYLYYTVNKRIGVAVADRPDGQFEDLKKTFCTNAIDANMVRDDDGQYYLYYVQLNDFKIHVQRMKSPVEKADEPPVFLFQPTEPWEKAKGSVTEGPWVIKHKGTFYMLYSGSGADSPFYSVGYATAQNPLGPFVKYAGNPIVKGGNGIFGPGHGCTAVDRKGNLWHVYHQKKSGAIKWDRDICLDPLWFDQDGVLHGQVSRGTEQPAPQPWR
ncbi:MAG TPA: glycoside hydrolase family 43 protein [Candidatus Sumerlaeota bacterium]|nr:glycoside hydrolase family 43 protein [Candidatus Sumerlaeota bacterium]HPS03527.1 glycoside hydrolase family 43 protein [Candidatus Sumerlaeota bacterium]